MNAAQLRLAATVSFGQKMTISNVFSSTVSDLTFQIGNLCPKQRDSHPVRYIFYFFQLLEICAHHHRYCFALPPGQDIH